MLVLGLVFVFWFCLFVCLFLLFISLAWRMVPPTVDKLSHFNLLNQSNPPEPISYVILDPIDLTTDNNHHKLLLDTLGWDCLHPTLAKAVFSESKSSSANSLRVRVFVRTPPHTRKLSSQCNPGPSWEQVSPPPSAEKEIPTF